MIPTCIPFTEGWSKQRNGMRQSQGDQELLRERQKAFVLLWDAGWLGCGFEGTATWSPPSNPFYQLDESNRDVVIVRLGIGEV